MAIDLSTCGILLKYAVETTAGTRPTTGYTKIPGVKSIPDINPEPNGIDSSTLEIPAGGFRTYVQGLKDLGSSLNFNANLTTELMTTWETLITASSTAESSGKSTWFEVYVPGLAESFYFKGKPAPLGMPEAGVDEVLDIDLHITPMGIEASPWATAST